MARTKELFPPRVRFNWGYHDARFDRERGLAGVVPNRTTTENWHTQLPSGTATERAYKAGYGAGLVSEETDTTSTAAWSFAKENGSNVFLQYPMDSGFGLSPA